LAASPAWGTQLGQLPSTVPATSCTSQLDLFQNHLQNGTNYEVRRDGRITSWSTFAAAGPNQTLTFKVFRGVAANAVQVVGHDGPRALQPSSLNIFTGLNIPVQIGDEIGVNSANAATVHNACTFLGGTGGLDTISRIAGNTPDGATAVYADSGTVNRRVNVSAILDPSNKFKFGEIALHKGKGTATLDVFFPGPGQMSFSGKGVKGGSGISVVGPATITPVTIKPKGKTKQTLAAAGRAKVKVNFTYTPDTGTANTESIKLKLKQL
jgi:hypothetical protein